MKTDLRIIDNKFPSSPGLRAKALRAFNETKAELATARAAQDARLKELLKDPAYEALRAKSISLKKEFNRLSGETRYHRYTVGSSVHGIAFLVEAEVDTIEEARAVVATKAA